MSEIPTCDTAPPVMWSEITAPQPAKTSAKVPMNSATSFAILEPRNELSGVNTMDPLETG